MTTEKRNLWIGIGIGFAAGSLITGTTVYCVSKKVERKKADERVRKEKRIAFMNGKETGYSDGYIKGVEESINNGEGAIKAAYQKGVDDATVEAQKWIDANMIVVDSSDPKAIQEAIEKGNISQNDGEKRLSEEDYGVKVDDNSVEELFKAPPLLPTNLSGKMYRIQHSSGKELAYPIEFFAENGHFLGPVQTRLYLREYEKDPEKLKLVWEAMGWGEYYPDPEEGVPPIEVINNYNVSIDDVSKMLEDSKYDPEPEEKIIDRERYLDRVEAYRNNPNAGIKYITYDEYSEESHLDHISLDYYAGDNTFLQPDDNDRKLEDPITDLGVSNGQILFDENPYKDRDPDLVCIENFGQHFVAEITRYKGSSTGISDGSAYLNGETGVVGGTTGV